MIVLTRIIFIVLTVLVPLWRVVFGVPPLIGIHVHGTGTILDEWNRWDTRWYDDLAQLGYNLRGPNGYKNVAFFPLYPLLIRTLHDVMAGGLRSVLGLAPGDPWYPPYLVPGLIVSNLCSIAALCYFYGLVRLDYGRGVAQRAVTLLALFPLSLFLFAAYSEGTFLLCAIAFFYAVRHERWWQAGLWGLLASATRPPGAVLVVPFVMAWAAAHPGAVTTLSARVRLHWRALLSRARTRLGRGASGEQLAVAGPTPIDLFAHQADVLTPRRRAGNLTSGAARVRQSLLMRPYAWAPEMRRALFDALPAVVIPLGLVFFMAALYRMFGDPLWFSHAQKAWWRTFAPPWETIYLSVAWPLGDLIHGTITYWDHYALQDLAYEIGGLVVTWLAWRRLPRTQGVYLWLLWVVLLSSPAMLAESKTGEPHHDVLMSLPRMLLMLFPLFTYLGLHRRLYPWLAGLSAIGLIAYTCIYLTGGWLS